MKATIKLSAGMMYITFADVEEKHRSVLARITMDLLRTYGRDRGLAWEQYDTGFKVQIIREHTSQDMYEAAKKVLQGYHLAFDSLTASVG